MKETEDLGEMLKSLGLMEYEAKAYLALLEFGNCTAEKLAQVSGIPLPRIYDTMTELQSKGFVLISKSRPKMFSPRPCDKALEHFISLQKKEMEAKLDSLRQNVRAAITELEKVQKVSTPEETSKMWSIEKRGNMIRMLQDRVSSAKKEIRIFAGDMSWIDDLLPSIKAAAKRGVKIRIVMADPKGSRQIMENMKKGKKAGAKVLTGYTGLLRAHVVDGENAYIWTKYSPEGGFNILEEGKSGSDVTRKYELLIMDNPTLVGAFIEYFELKWKELSKK
ncbi:MAG: helix-turn-helix domain-containing protein [Candidatus Aenigmatarchaeota archaeon]